MPHAKTNRRPASASARRKTLSATDEPAVLPKIRVLVPRLLKWFGRNARDLPWRCTRDPYAIWVSEIMLQQTQVKTVLPYWDRWMRALPTLTALAEANSPQIHKLWEGLGYYRRVRSMQQAARQIVQRHGGKFPESYEEILALPGVGRYTAGAISSIAFNQPAPVLDGNVIRVLTRVFGIGEDPRTRPTSDRLWALAHQLVRQAATRPSTRVQRCSCLNQSLMELGAVICMPRSPRCGACPVAHHCAARAEGRPEAYPLRPPKLGSTNRHGFVFVVEHRGRFLIRQRPAGGVNAHLWEFPSVEVVVGKAPPDEAARELFGFPPQHLESLAVIQHTITRYRITLDVFRAEFAVALNRTSDHRWQTLRQMEALAFTAAHRRILEQLGSTAAGGRKSQSQRRKL